MITVVNFHEVTDFYWFESVVEYLRSRFRFITADELLEKYKTKEGGENLCHITIDDGDISFYNIIFPVLKKQSIPATLFLSPKTCINGTNFWFQEIEGYNPKIIKKIVADICKLNYEELLHYNFHSVLKTLKIETIHDVINYYRIKANIPVKSFRNMTVKNVKEVYKSGIIEIGAHTVNHPILANENIFDSCCEVKDSVDMMSGIINRPVKYFAYPNGIPLLDFSDREYYSLKTSDVQLAFSTVSKHVSPADHCYNIPRLQIADLENQGLIKAKILLGSTWEFLKEHKPRGWYKERNELRKLFSSVAK